MEGIVLGITMTMIEVWMSCQWNLIKSKGGEEEGETTKSTGLFLKLSHLG